jgi:hypothetical protein
MRSMLSWGLGGLLAVAMVGCGGEDMRGPQSPTSNAKSYYGGGGGSPASDGPAEMAPTAATGGATVQATPTGPRGEESASAPSPAERPGLGTEWGEARESHVREVSFSRADHDHPFAMASLFYNDLAGVEAMAAYHGGTPRFRDVPAFGSQVTVSIRDASGEPLDAMHVGDRTYVIGHDGERYSVVLSNHTGRRVEAVTTVDGLDVINGKSGSFDNRGYVLMPWASLEIDGFRQSEDSVAAFRFGKVKDSYAAQTGDSRNVGVIGVALFAERGDTWSFDDAHTRDTASPFPSDPRFAPPPR